MMAEIVTLVLGNLGSSSPARAPAHLQQELVEHIVDSERIPDIAGFIILFVNVAYRLNLQRRRRTTK